MLFRSRSNTSPLDRRPPMASHAVVAVAKSEGHETSATIVHKKTGSTVSPIDRRAIGEALEALISQELMEQFAQLEGEEKAEGLGDADHGADAAGADRERDRDGDDHEADGGRGQDGVVTHHVGRVGSAGIEASLVEIGRASCRERVY